MAPRHVPDSKGHSATHRLSPSGVCACGFPMEPLPRRYVACQVYTFPFLIKSVFTPLKNSSSSSPFWLHTELWVKQCATQCTKYFNIVYISQYVQKLTWSGWQHRREDETRRHAGSGPVTRAATRGTRYRWWSQVPRVRVRDARDT